MAGLIGDMASARWPGAAASISTVAAARLRQRTKPRLGSALLLTFEVVILDVVIPGVAVPGVVVLGVFMLAIVMLGVSLKLGDESARPFEAGFRHWFICDRPKC